jgi:hypothetical protein
MNVRINTKEKMMYKRIAVRFSRESSLGEGRVSCHGRFFHLLRLGAASSLMMMCITVASGDARASDCDLTFADAAAIFEGSTDANPDPRGDASGDGVVSLVELEAFMNSPCVLAALAERE